MAQFASSSGIVDPVVGYVLAIGVEWAYLRGLVADSKATTEWGARLNWSAFAIVVLWGCLWCLRRFGVIAETPTNALAYFLAAAHVVPIAWLSLCSAMSHRAMVQAEAEATKEQQQAQADEDRRNREAINALHIKEAEERLKIELWKDAQTFKAQLNATKPTNRKTTVQPVATGTKVCQFCNQVVSYQTASEAGVIARRGCVECRAKRKAKEG